ncbi:MAG TPA: M28 family peptidase [Candidatus Thermoplasmatota archaeon]|nr:M28 family peptidase [Candidatus Thermoplasmatota archaeon]
MERILAVALLAAALAGCAQNGQGEPPFTFDGDGAFDAVRLLVEDPNGSPRFRVPGTAGHEDASRALWEAMRATGWEVRFQNFTGAMYQELGRGSFQDWNEDPAHCGEEDRDELPGLRFSNLVATWPGREDRMLWLGAHWDSKEEADRDPDPGRRNEPVLGANDGASGVGVLLRLMQHVAEGDVEVPFGLGIVFFDGEDGFVDCHPLAGSLFFVSRLLAGEVGRFILLDMVGDADARFPRESHSVQGDPGLVDLLWRHAPAAGLAENFLDDERGVGGDDHFPFLEAGIPAVDIIDLGRERPESSTGFPPYWHTTGDTLDKIDAGMLGRVGGLLVATLTDDDLASEWPAATPAAS